MMMIYQMSSIKLFPLCQKLTIQWVECLDLKREVLSEYQIYSWTLSGAMLSYTFINSHCQATDLGP